MTTRIWNVKFGSWTSANTVAPNIKEAINNVRQSRKGEYFNRIQDITDVTLESEAD